MLISCIGSSQHVFMIQLYQPDNCYQGGSIPNTCPFWSPYAQAKQSTEQASIEKNQKKNTRLLKEWQVFFFFSPPSASSLRIQKADMESISLQSDSLTQITKLLLNLPSDACTAVSDRLRCGGFMQCGKHQAVSGCLLSPASRSHCFQAVHQQGAEQGGEHPTQPNPAPSQSSHSKAASG